jgi:hypothetical protein
MFKLVEVGTLGQKSISSANRLKSYQTIFHFM